jgi:DNA polymerase III delta subunit
VDSRPNADPFSPLAPLLAALRQAPLPAVFFVSGDDDWIVAEAVRRLTAAFRGAFPESEVTRHEGTTEGVREAVADAATVALFSANRLVVLDATELLRTKKVTAEEIDALLDETAEAGLSAGATGPASEGLRRTARKARALAAAAGIEASTDPEDAARRLAGRVKRADRAGDLARLLAFAAEGGEGGEVSAAPLLDFAGRAVAGDNALLVHAFTPDADHKATAILRRAGPSADLGAGSDDARVERLVGLGVERAVERGALVDPEVFDILTERGRLSAREFLSDLDKLIDGAAGKRVPPEDAARFIDDRRKEYGSDFVEAVATRRFVDALQILERLLSAPDFTAFRRSGGREEEAPPRKGPRGDAAFFPILGLLAGELRRMLTVKAAFAERGLDAGRGRRVDYRTFADRVLPTLKAPRAGAPPLPADAHPFVLFKAYLAAEAWTLEELLFAMTALAGVDRGAKSGSGAGFELMEAWLFSRVSR